MNKHTPGPWLVVQTNRGFQIQGETDSRIVADLRWAGFDPETEYANAKLIAAAPLMASLLFLFLSSDSTEYLFTKDERDEVQRVLKIAGAL